MFFLATDNASKIREEIQRCLELDSPNLSIEVYASSDPPKQLGKRLAWHLAGTLNLLSPKKSQPSGSASTTLQLGDFNWPWAADRFTETVTQFQPDSIIIEYVKLAYLIEDLGQQSKPVQMIIDTHDMLHKRYQDFKERGESHWISINAAEEAEVLDRFDTCLLYTSPSPRDRTRSRMPSSA